MSERITVLIPSYEPNEKMEKLVKELCLERDMDVVIVNDGSDKSYDPFFEACRQINHCTVLGYDKNHGKGYALKYGFRYILDNLPEANRIVTADSDGQHTPLDIARVADAVAENPGTLVLGARDCLQENVPARSRFGNVMTRNVFRLVAGYKIKDTQTGLRGFDRTSAEAFSDTEGDRFEYEMRVLMEARGKKIRILEIPIETVYEADRTTHFSTFRDSFRVYSVFFGHIVKYSGVSILCYVTELLIYSLLFSLLARQSVFSFGGVSFADALKDSSMLVAFLIARFLSATANFTLNRKVVFRAKGKLLPEIGEYAALAVIVALFTYLLIAFFTFIGIGSFWAHPLSTAIMFVVSYFVQKKVIFKK